MNKSDLSYYSSLLDKYYQGDTTLEEEKALGAFFKNASADNLPEDMIIGKDIFDGMRQMTCMDESMQAVPDGLEERLAAYIDKLASQDANPDQVSFGKSPRIIKLSAWISGAAACLIGALLVTSVFRNDHNNTADSNIAAGITLESERPDSRQAASSDDDTLMLRLESAPMHTASASAEPVRVRVRTQRQPRPEMTPEEINAEVERALEVVQQAFAKGLTRVEEADREISDSNRRTSEILQDALTIDLPGINRPLPI